MCDKNLFLDLQLWKKKKKAVYESKLLGNVGGSNSSFDQLPDSGVLICFQLMCFNLIEFLGCNGKPVQQKLSFHIFILHSVSIAVALNHFYIIWLFFRFPNLVISKFVTYHLFRPGSFNTGCNANLWGAILVVFLQSNNCSLNTDGDTFSIFFLNFLTMNSIILILPPRSNLIHITF